MTSEGPPLELLLRRLAETPPDFRDEPRIGKTGRIAVGAVIGDLCDALGVPVGERALLPFVGTNARRDRNRLAIALVYAWMLAEPALAGALVATGDVPALIAEAAGELAPHTAAARFVDDPERREELARHVLARLALRPAGETDEQAADRLTSLSAAERARVMAASRAAEQRAREIREALARKAAEESADKWSRE